jgi:hypothetical protein
MPLHDLLRREQAQPHEASTDARSTPMSAGERHAPARGAAYECWAGWETHERSLALAAYLAALEDEEHAARLYERRIHDVRCSVLPRLPVTSGARRD